MAQLLWWGVLLVSVVSGDLDWEWGDKFYSRCTVKLARLPPSDLPNYKGLCARLQEVVEGTFTKTGNMVQNAYQTTNWDTKKIVKRYSSSGEAMLDDFAEWGIKHWPQSERECVVRFGQLFIPWYKSILDQAIDSGYLPELKDL